MQLAGQLPAKRDIDAMRDYSSLSIHLPTLLLLFDLEQQRAVDVRQDTSESDRGADERVEFFVAADGELQMAGRDTLDFEVFGGVTSELENFGSQVFENGGDIDGG